MSLMDIAEIIIIPLTIIIVNYFFQKRTKNEIQIQGAQLQKEIQEEIEELKHELATERFLTEKHWDEMSSLYIDLSKIIPGIFEYMIRFKKIFLDKDPHFRPFILFHIFSEIHGTHVEPIEAHFADSEITYEAYEMIDETLRPKHFRELVEKLKDMQGRVSIFASPEINGIYTDLFVLTTVFINQLSRRIILLAHESTRRAHSPADKNAMERLSKSDIDSFQPILDDVQPVLDKFREKHIQMHRCMREELRTGKMNLKPSQ